jgi:hypothetical protein
MPSKVGRTWQCANHPLLTAPILSIDGEVAIASPAGRATLKPGGHMTAHVGDTIVVESERVRQTGRAGVIEEVLQEDPPRLRVKWEDGHRSILTPSAGAARIIPKKTRAKPKP